MDARRRFAGRFEVSGSFDLSRVAGSPAAIARTQQDPVHLYQRPDGPLEFDSDPHLAERHQSGAPVRQGRRQAAPASRPPTSGARRGSRSTTSASSARPTSRRGPPGPPWPSGTPTGSSASCAGTSTTGSTGAVAGLPTERAFNTNVHTQFNNRWWLHMGGTLGQLGATYCDRCARGGPAIRQDPYIAPWIGIEGDDRRPLVPTLWVNYWRGRRGPLGDDRAGAGRSSSRCPRRFTTSLGASVRAQPQRHPVLRHVHRLRRGRRTTPSRTWSSGR